MSTNATTSNEALLLDALRLQIDESAFAVSRESGVEIIRQHVAQEAAAKDALVATLSAELAAIRETLQSGLDRDRDNTSTRHLAIVATNGLYWRNILIARMRESGNALAEKLAPGPIPAEYPTEIDMLLANWEGSVSTTPDGVGAELAALREDKALLDAFDLVGRQDDVQPRQISEDECEPELLGHFWQTPTVQSSSCRDAIRAAIGAGSAPNQPRA